MKKLLFASSLVFFLLGACNTNKSAGTTNEELTKEDKVINHGSQNQARMDSIKASKTKGKQ